jgi:hypothetical protein
MEGNLNFYKQVSAAPLRSLILHGCRMEVYMDVFTASSERRCGYLRDLRKMHRSVSEFIAL